jgi:hypothetical protein
MALTRPVGLRVDFRVERGRVEGFVAFTEDARGQWSWLCDSEVGPFDTWQDIGLRVSCALYRQGGALNR